MKNLETYPHIRSIFDIYCTVEQRRNVVRINSTETMGKIKPLSHSAPKSVADV